MAQMELISTLEYGKRLDNIKELTNNHVLHIFDFFDQQYLDQILKKGTPGAIVSDAYLMKPPYSNTIPFYGLPIWIAEDTLKIIDGYKFDSNMSTTNCFNFMINMKRINRFLCIKLVENFKLSNFDYTWPAIDQNFDMSYILDEITSLGDQNPLDQATQAFMLSPIKLQKRFIEFKGEVKFDRTSMAQGAGVANYGGNSWAWRNGLDKMFSSSAISLITESGETSKAAGFTEKTIFSVLGLTFPIWVGGYNQATEWKDIGFDVFDDIIDHSYQSYDTLIERCYYAFANNLDLLSNKDKSAKLRLSCHDRLLKNRELLLNNHLTTIVNNKTSAWPQELQSCVPELLKLTTEAWREKEII